VGFTPPFVARGGVNPALLCVLHSLEEFGNQTERLNDGQHPDRPHLTNSGFEFSLVNSLMLDTNNPIAVRWLYRRCDLKQLTDLGTTLTSDPSNTLTVSAAPKQDDLDDKTFVG
jgi:hypothetical protein